MKNNVLPAKMRETYVSAKAARGPGRPPFELAANPVNANEIDIYIYGYVMDERDAWDEGIDCVVTKEIREQLLTIKAGVINLHINSCGGMAFEGVAIHNLLKQHNAAINVYIDGIAASAASIIAMAGDRIYMPANTMMMIHRASVITWGNADTLRKDADMLDKLDTAVRSSYMARFAGTEEELRDLLADETYLTAAEALALGFCDEILDEIKPDPDPATNDDGDVELPKRNAGATRNAIPEPPKNALLKKYGNAAGNAAVNDERDEAANDKTSALLSAFFCGLNGNIK